MWATAQGKEAPLLTRPSRHTYYTAFGHNHVELCCTEYTPRSMSVHMYTLRDMDVHELGSPGHPRSNHALSCVAFSNKRKRAPLARSTSPAPRRPPRESETGDGARCARREGLREGEGSSAQQEPVDMRQQELGSARNRIRLIQSNIIRPRSWMGRFQQLDLGELRKLTKWPRRLEGVIVRPGRGTYYPGHLCCWAESTPWGTRGGCTPPKARGARCATLLQSPKTGKSDISRKGEMWCVFQSGVAPPGLGRPYRTLPGRHTPPNT